MFRYIRAFFIALKITLTGGEVPKAAPAPASLPLEHWRETSLAALETVYRIAQAQGLTRPEREKLKLHIEGRDMSVEMILSTIRYHLIDEYPYLLRNVTKNHIMAIYATNMNDHFWVIKLQQHPLSQQHPELGQALNTLADQLEAIPSDA